MNMFLIELYKVFIHKKHETTPNEEEMKDILCFKDFLFLMNYQNGELIKEDCICEFYFLLMTNEFELATTLLSKNYSESLKLSLVDVFIDDDSSILQGILFNEDIVLHSIKSSIEKALDGVAL